MQSDSIPFRVEKHATKAVLADAGFGHHDLSTRGLHLAERNAGVFRLMFRPELTQPAKHEVLRQAESRAFGKLLETVAGAQQAGELPGRDPRPIAAACWSTMHSLAVLHADQVLGETPLADVPIESLVQYVVEFATVGAIHTTGPAE